MKTLLTLLKILCSIAISCAFIYFVYWVYKSGSYFFFYEGFVKDTIKEVVLNECLIK